VGGGADQYPLSGDKILAARFGQFSHLWVDMAQRPLGYEVEALDVEWGEGVPLDRYEESSGPTSDTRSRVCSPAITRTATGVTSDNRPSAQGSG